MICPISKYKQNSQRGLAVAHAKSELEVGQISTDSNRCACVHGLNQVKIIDNAHRQVGLSVPYALMT